MGVEVVAGWDHDSERLAAAVERHGVAPVASSAELLARDDVDAVVITAETSMHADLVEQAAEAGKAIILQKPIALTMEQAGRIVSAVKADGVPFTMAWQMRVDPQNLKMKELIEDGTLGRIFMVRRRHGLPVLLNAAFRTSWHVDPELNRDIWADDAPHAIDFLYWLFGMPVSVTAELTTQYDQQTPNDNCLAIFRYASGMLAVVSSSFVCCAGENTTEIVGEKGVLVQNYGDAPSADKKPPGAICLKWFLNGASEWTISDDPGFDGQGLRIANLAQPLADFLNGKRAPLATAEEGRDVLRITLATYESSEEGKRVEL
jgi:predicted dehydrogenase